MASLLVATVAGFLAARLVWLAARPWFAQPAFLRPNYRGRMLPNAAGMVIPLALVVVEAGRALAASVGVGDAASLDGSQALVVVTALGFGLLGVIDDVGGSGDHRGFRGHALALVSGKFTTGALKVLGGAALAVVVVAPWVPARSPGRLLADGALVALAANLGNLFDRAPGRVLKVAVAAFAALAVLSEARGHLVGVAATVGAGLGLLVEDLREHLMLGDAGANVLGAVLGLGVVMSVGPGARNAVLGALVVLNLLGEVASFSRVIAAVAPLRALDQAGRRRPPPEA